MTRSVAAWLALVVLVGLTVATWVLAEGAASAGALAAVAAIKIAVVGLVFLELGRSWPVWGLLFGLGVVGVLGGAAFWIGAA